MADIADMTQERIERLEDVTQRLGRVQTMTGPAPTGACLYCGEPLDPPRRWCDAGCRDEWAYTQARRQAQQGVRHG
ncbi:hypothetical protein AGMMS49960_17550 [Betaproteobacteria bacterium]|nr:hypothetical protein AGMMS49543_09760 [Betaproteobacteria bacterium]GHU03346.1 hypothetical protein AGMMS49960_17550 [Betaproteobacteria bacterium]GHU16946.1 hypothetical protein AGMMS50243_04290 [Betaproteobacteria bacterium]